jgi:hypothetical protein
MSSREILDAILRGVEESAQRAAEHKPEHAGPPLREQPARSIGEMTAREILEAIHMGLEETSLSLSSEILANARIGFERKRKYPSRD